MDFWLVLGFFAQALFFMRFLFQWIASEIRKESYIPNVFWFFSVCGGLLLLAYAIHRKDPVFILGQSLGSFIYLRNIVLIYGKKAKQVREGM